MFAVFWNATSFNQCLNMWDIRNVRTMKRMFCGATSFHWRYIMSWVLSYVYLMDHFLDDVPLDCLDKCLMFLLPNIPTERVP